MHTEHLLAGTMNKEFASLMQRQTNVSLSIALSFNQGPRISNIQMFHGKFGDVLWRVS